MNDPGQDTRKGPGLSRREFLKGSSVTAAATALAQAPAVALAGAAAAEGEAAGAVAIGPGAAKVTVKVNGASMSYSVEPRVTLLDLLRNHLDVTACKRVCDRGTCGACTVLLDGKPIYACTMLAVEANGREVTTAEALKSGNRLDKVPAAFVKHDAQQCGFCTPGFVVAMHAVFASNPRPTPAEVEDGLAGNICRCGTYQQMRHAIRELCGVATGTTEKKEG
jgi:xanthine dehydrogenase YagT iron-sulfur-binding subunit